MNRNIKMTITQFNRYTDEELNTYTDSLDNILNQIDNYEKYYYRITVFGKNTNPKKVKDTYFGVTTSSVGGLKLTEADYLNNYLNHIIAKYKKGLPFSFWQVINRDNKYLERMEQLSKNTEKGFQEAINRFLDDNLRFKEITDLNIVKEIPGIYFLILDEYNACYIGQAKNIKKRIMRHWSVNDYFTGTGIDMFKAKDTTRIFVFPMSEKEYNRINIFEYFLVGSIPGQYELNILSGGKPDFLIENNLPLIPKDENDKKAEPNEDWAYKLTKILIQQNEKVAQNMSRFIIE